MRYESDEFARERSFELESSLDRDEDHEPRGRRFTLSGPEIGSSTTPTTCHILPSRVDARAKRAVDNSRIVDGKKASRSHVGSSQRCAILRREA